jgi:RNA polymerase sigma-70 factor
LDKMLASSAVRDSIRRFETSGASDGDILQRLRQKLLVGVPPDEPRIAMYAGRAPLRGWLRAAAVRTATDLVKRQRPVEPMEALDQMTFLSADPELELLRHQHRDTFRAALRGAVADLSELLRISGLPSGRQLPARPDRRRLQRRVLAEQGALLHSGHVQNGLELP